MTVLSHNKLARMQLFMIIRNCVKLQLHDAICRLRFYSNSLTHILLLSNSHNNVALIQKNRGDRFIMHYLAYTV